MTRARLEVCVDTLEGLEIAAETGADRIELCSCLSTGGLTPSPGLMQAATQVSCPTRVMIRPREGDFTYSAGEIDMMLRDIDAVAGLGLDGVVLGANHISGALDEVVLQSLTDHAIQAGLKVTLHRSFDLAPDLNAALQIARDLGLHSVLTSGGALKAASGLAALSELVTTTNATGQDIEVMAGVGIGSRTVREIIEQTGVGWVHGSCSLPRAIVSDEAFRLGYSSPDHRRTDALEIRRILDVLEAIAAPQDSTDQTFSPRLAL